MAATVQISETNGPLASAVETANISNLNMGSGDVVNLDPATYPLTAIANGHAYEKWIRIFVSNMGWSTIIDNLKVWLSDLGTGWKTDEGISCNLKVSGYSAASYPSSGPIMTDSSEADVAMPESEPVGPNIGIGGALSGQIVAAPNYSDYIVLQLDFSNLTPAGNTSAKTITFQYDER